MNKFARIIVFTLAMTAVLMGGTSVKAQTYQAKTDTMWGNWCYKFQNGEFYSKQENKASITTLSTPSTGMTLVYYLRIPETGARADFVYTPKYARMPKIKLTVTRVSTGDTLCVSETQNTSITLTGKEIKVELLPYTKFPADEYYRFELSCDNWAYVNNVKHFLFQRTSTMSILQHPQGGYGQHLFDWGTTIPEAPTGKAYDWAYQEVLVPRAYQHPADYYCTIAALQCYCGIQSVGRVGNNFNRTVLFSCWDSGNTDENPDLPHYLRAKVYDYNHLGVSGHGGGEGSSGTIQLNNDTTWWRSDEWVQFLMNVRPENADEVEYNKNSDEDEVHSVENTLISVWYKMASDSAWTYLATIREACKNEMIGGWYSFLENFGGSEGHQPHKVYYRHGYMRSAASGKWYNRNNVSFRHYDDRTTRTDRYSGSTNLYENAFQMVYGGWGLATDSSNVAGLPATDIAVDTINLDPMNKRVDQAAQLWRHFSLMEELNKKSGKHAYSNWTILSSTGTNANGMLNGNSTSYWESNNSEGHEVVLQSKSGVVPLTSFHLHFPDGRSVRTRYVDAYTSTDGQNWTLGAKDVFINNEDDNDVTLPNTLRAEYFKLFFHEQLDKKSSPRLKISTLELRDDYDLDKLKAVAKDIIDNENALQYYKTEDIAQLKEIYANGSCTSTDDLSAEIKRIYKDCFPLMYGRAAATAYITATKAYMMQNVAGNGCLSADGNGLKVKGATADNAKESTKESADATDPNNTWQIIQSEKYSNVYVFNLGVKKYLNPDGEGWLSDEPYPFSAGISGKGCALRSMKEGAEENGKYLCVNSSLDQPFYWGGLVDNGRYLLLEDYYMRPENAEAMKQVEKTYTNQRLESSKSRLLELLDVPSGRVGSIESDETKAELEAMYNGGDVKEEDIEKFIDAVNNVKLLDLDEQHVYTFTNTSETSTPCLAVSASGLSLLAANTTKAGQMWSVAKKGYGAAITSQGCGLGMMPRSTGGSPKAGSIAITPSENATMYYLTETAPGEYNLADYSYPTYGIGINSTSAACIATTNATSKWNVDIVKEYTVRTNSVGVTSLCVDFELKLAEGQQVYVASYITQDGVIKLSAITGTVPARTPIIIKDEPNSPVTFGVSLNTTAPYEFDNIFSGCLIKRTDLKKNEYYTLKINNNQQMMKKATLSNLAADNEIYILKDATMPELTYYTFDFDDLVDSVDKKVAVEANGSTDTCFDLQGRPSNGQEHGMYIVGNKVVKK